MWVVSVWGVLMVVCVSPGCRSQEVLTPDELQRDIMPQILNTYGNRIQGQYSLAISVPRDHATRQYHFQRVFDADPAEQVIAAFTNGNRVYTGTYVVAARVLQRQAPQGNQHSEFRVLAATRRIENRNVNAVESLQGRDLLIFYTLNSPCWTTCTVPGHREGILERITVMATGKARPFDPIPRPWTRYGLVFTQAFLPRGWETPEQLKEAVGLRRVALNSLAGSLGSHGSPGITHIYRCWHGVCFSCAGNQYTVLRRCVTLDGAQVM